jgi:hypothetical protein
MHYWFQRENINVILNKGSASKAVYDETKMKTKLYYIHSLV